VAAGPDGAPQPGVDRLDGVVQTTAGISRSKARKGTNSGHADPYLNKFRSKWTLCLRRHKVHYAELPIMPTGRRVPLVAAA